MARRSKIIEGTWDCTSCGTSKISVRNRTCPNCGSAKGDGEHFSKEGGRYLSAEEAAKISRNPDWYCSYCNTLNSDDSEFCESCGSSKTESTMNYFQMKQKEEDEARERDKEDEARERDKEDEARGQDKEDEVRELVEEDEVEIPTTSTQSMPNCFSSARFGGISTTDTGCGLKKVFLGVLGVLSAFLLIFLLIPKNKEITVDELYWDSVVTLEELQDIDHSGWTLPIGSTLRYTKEEVYDTYQEIVGYDYDEVQKSKQVQTGTKEVLVETKDLGNGYFEEIYDDVPVYETIYYTETVQVPKYETKYVYKTKYYYTMKEYVVSRNLRESGSEEDKVYFSDFVLNTETSERELRRGVNYSLLTEDGDKYTIEEEDYNSLDEGDVVKIKVLFGHAEVVTE